MEFDVRDAIRKFDSMTRQLSGAQVAKAVTMAMNEALRHGRTVMRRSIQETYNIKTARINDRDIHRGIAIRKADPNTLTGMLTAGHRPVKFADVKGVRRTKKGVSVEVKKNQRKIIRSAFPIGRFKHHKTGETIELDKPVIMARGRFGRPGFAFGKSRMPIAPLATTSIATAAMATGVATKWQQPVYDYYEKRLEHHLKRMVNALPST